MSLLTALAVLAAVGLLFAMDPGGAIAESGFPDFRQMDWKQLAAWGLRTIGVVFAQLLIIVLWLWPKHRPPETLEVHRRSWYAGGPRSGGMPAAAVSALQGHMIGTRTMLASIIEMCQRGTLRIEPIRTRVGFLYRLSRQDQAQYDWERLICNILPSSPTTVEALHDRLKAHEDSIGDKLGEFLVQQGFFDHNPVRVRRESPGDGAEWAVLAGALTGIGGGLWLALWLSQWWANALIGGFMGFMYLLVAPSVPSGMVPPTQRGSHEISQWLGWKETLAASAQAGARDQPENMSAYAVGLDVAQPWLDLSVSAPQWFGSGSATSLQDADLASAYHAFMHAPEWYLSGRSDDAAKGAAGMGNELEIELLNLDSPDTESTAHRGTAGEVQVEAHDLGSERGSKEAAPAPPSARYHQYTAERRAEEPEGGGCLRGCLMWAIGLVGIGIVALLVLFSLDVVSPRDKPCPLDSPPIPTPAQIAVVGDLFRDECVRVRGTVVSQATGELVMEIDRDEYVQRVDVRDPSQALEAIPQGRVLTLAGRLRVEEGGTYSVHFIRDRGSDREWWRNLLENLAALF